jgi:hypothetical protein
MGAVAGERMRKVIFVMMAVLAWYNLTPAQTTKLIFGPRDGDDAGILYADTNEVIELDLWIRTVPDICLVGIHLPLSSNNLYIQSDSRDSGEIFYPLSEWGEVAFLPPNDDITNPGFVNQSLLAIEDLIGDPPDYNCMLLWNNWFKWASYRVTTTVNASYDTLICDAFIEGYDPDNGDFVLVDFYRGEMDRSMYEVEFACLMFAESVCGQYIIGDFNNSGDFNIADVTDSFSKLKTGSPEADLLCECPPESGGQWAVAMDVNNSCMFNIADVVTAYSKLKTGQPELIPCAYCPPEGWEP